MADKTQEVYQDNGFELVIYKDRESHPFKTCPDCGRKVFLIANIYDEWQEGQSSIIEYFYCKKDKHILQLNSRKRHDGYSTTHQQIHHIPPHEMSMQILAYARHIQGRGITRLTINKRWWQAWRYPLAVGDQIATRMPRVRPSVSEEDSRSSQLTDEQALHNIPLPRYQERDGANNNPFTSRRVDREDEMNDSNEMSDEPQEPLQSATQQTDSDSAATNTSTDRFDEALNLLDEDETTT